MGRADWPREISQQQLGQPDAGDAAYLEGSGRALDEANGFVNYHRQTLHGRGVAEHLAAPADGGEGKTGGGRIKDIVSGSAKGSLCHQNGKQRSPNHDIQRDGRRHQHGDDQSGDHGAQVTRVDFLVQQQTAHPVCQQTGQHRNSADQKDARPIVKEGHTKQRHQSDDHIAHHRPARFGVPDIGCMMDQWIQG